MKLQRIVHKEELVSRLPALFAYIEDNALGDSELHSAYDSKMGCYGKVVENIMLPENVSVVVDDETLLKGGTIHSYRTIMNCYYNYHSTLNTEFLDFVDKAIGRIEIPSKTFTKDMDLVPSYIYLATVNNLYNEMVKMDKQCKFYNWRKDKDGEDAYMCCLCDRFERMGGETMIDFLKGYLSLAEERANEYLGYAQNAQLKPISINIPLQITRSSLDLGLVTPHITQWVAGDTYYKGDKVYYDGSIYTCKVEQTSGAYNSETELISFDSEKWEIDPLYSFTGKRVEIGGFTDSKLKSLRRYTTYLNEYDTEERPEKDEDWLFYYRIGEVVNIETANDDFGNILRYKDIDNTLSEGKYNEEVEPYVNEEYPWGNPHEGKTIIADNLFAYGDVLYDITADKEEKTIVFKYYIGIHLTATVVGSDTDDDGNYHYYFTDFQPDLSETHQRHIIEYTETYTYEPDSDLAMLIEEEMFDNYVSGYYDMGGEGYNSDNYIILKAKYEFSTYNNLVYYTKWVGPYSIDLTMITADFKTDIDWFRDWQKTNLHRVEYYAGVSYSPTDDIDVYITRGDTTAFEKFIKFSEVKTLSAMERYSNGSFFTMKSDM